MEPAASTKRDHAWLVQRVRDLEAEKREAALRSELQAERVARQLQEERVARQLDKAATALQTQASGLSVGRLLIDS